MKTLRQIFNVTVNAVGFMLLVLFVVGFYLIGVGLREKDARMLGVGTLWSIGHIVIIGMIVLSLIR